MPIGMALWGFFTSSPERRTKLELSDVTGVLEGHYSFDLFTLTCCGNAVKSHKGVKTSGSTRKDPSPTKRHKAAFTRSFLVF